MLSPNGTTILGCQRLLAADDVQRARKQRAVVRITGTYGESMYCSSCGAFAMSKRRHVLGLCVVYRAILGGSGETPPRSTRFPGVARPAPYGFHSLAKAQGRITEYMNRAAARFEGPQVRTVRSRFARLCITLPSSLESNTSNVTLGNR